MCWRNTLDKWGGITQLFHWGMMLTFVGMFTVAYIMMDMPDGNDKWWFYGMHKQIGVTLFLLVTVRLWWRMKNDVPRDPASVPHWQAVAARSNIYVLYTLMFAFPLSGLLMSILGGHDVSYFGLFTLPAFMQGPNAYGKFFRESHEYISYLMMGFVGLHVIAALYHHFFLKNDVLRRMLPGYKG